ncbi:hypothetical protein NKR19_g3561 [Coniochaeta hoffmannii]|uniref:Uncharacterized protein n=1 Tax=Coniochaeta hoffmannii TaxID=91930 RepID=A0AA38S8J0_9PEZI|nr:hypothetical protein NKR19_g3561 [Coniochaeta hoffmannii]
MGGSHHSADRKKKKKKKKTKTYNTRDSPVVTHPSTSLAITGLSMGERTGSQEKMMPNIVSQEPSNRDTEALEIGMQ